MDQEDPTIFLFILFLISFLGHNSTEPPNEINWYCDAV